MNQTWEEANKWEADWHGDCINSYNEETKQYIYAHLMGMDAYAVNYHGQIGWDMGEKYVMDVGCGPYSLLLKVKTKGQKAGIDPCPYPSWVYQRYKESGVKIFPICGEDLSEAQIPDGISHFDEVLLYNCLQHTKDPEKICRNIISLAHTVRVFEWIDTGTAPGHLHDLKAPLLNQWLGGEGRVVDLQQWPCIGRAYFGIFKGKYYGR